MSGRYKFGRFFDKEESLLLSQGLLITWSVHPPNKNIPKHKHELPYLSVVVSGNYRELGENFDQTIVSGSAIFHPANENHENMIGDHGATVINFEFNEEFWSERKITEIQPVNRIICNDSRIHSFAREMNVQMNLSKRMSLLGIEGLALMLLDAFLTKEESFDDVDILKSVEQHLRVNFKKRINLDETAALFDIKKNVLRRRFRRYFGETFTDRIIRLRIQEASRLLSETDLPISDVAIASGFFDQSHLTRHFKKHKGITPNSYRVYR